MKTLNILRNSALVGFLALGAVAILAPDISLAQGKGASKLMFPASTSQSQTQTSVTGSRAMTCTRCTDGYTKVIDASAKGIRAQSTRMVAVHMCPACQTKIASVGAGKAKADKVTHSCGSSGVEASCCVAAR